MKQINFYLRNLNENKKEGIIAVDLDGTLAHYDKWRGYNHIGDPIPKMMNRVKRWIKSGRKVVIFTARANDGKKAIDPIKQWLKDNDLPDLEITNIKTPEMTEFWDDRATGIKINTGDIKK